MNDTPNATPDHRGRRRRLRTRGLAGSVALFTAVPLALAVPAAGTLAHAAPVGQGFNLNDSDLRFILKQIKISENHVATTTSATGPCGALLGPGADQIPANGVGVTLPWGLRTVDGTCNNIQVDQADFGSADRPFPRLVPKKLRPDYPTGSNVTDAGPRTISNLIVDQTATNPAAVQAAGSSPAEREVTSSGAFVIPNVAPDTGLSAPYNSWFTLFGQFFDHGLDLVNKGGAGTVTMPLNPDDPLYDATPGARTNLMTLTRASVNASGEATNQTSPWIDQSQTYSSHPSHQVFLREYTLVDGKPVGTGRMLTGVGDGMATWKRVKEQARQVLGIALTDREALDVPTVLTDQYGRFVRGGNGLPQLVLADGTTRPADLTTPASTDGVRPTGHAFLDDIAHTAVPSGTKTADTDGDINSLTAAPSRTTYDDEMLDAHFVAGDGRVNENIGLITVHHVFHSEHNRLTRDIDTMLKSASFTDAERADWATTSRPSGWDYGERLFQAARFVTEMEYQHLAFEEFARKVQPMVNLFGEGGTGYRSDIDPAISAEFAHAVYRFGHSMLNESVDRQRADGSRHDISLLTAFLNPPRFLDGGTDPEAAAGDIVRGMTQQVGNELDEFVTEALRNELLGLPLDLASLNLARARDTGVPTLNAARRTFYAQTSDSGLQPYSSWADFGFSLKHSASLVNFIAAYGTHPTITAATTVATKRAAAKAVLDNASEEDPAVSEPARAFLNGPAATTGVDDVDLWIGGLAEKQNVFGGLLGATFNHVFERQMENLQDADRFYYLSRTAGLNLLTQLEGNSFSELIQRNTDVQGLPADSFSRPGFVFDLAAQPASGAIVDDPATEYDERTMLVREPDGTIRYTGTEHVVFNGRDKDATGAGLSDRMRSSEGDDTLRGNDGNDRMEGGDGNDNLIGGLGDDIMTDLFGDDTLKGGDGDDAMSSGRGFAGDLNQGGRGNDFIVGGNDTTETFAGPGNDFVFAGDAEDTVFGDDGDDWIEGGQGPFNLLQGDNGAPFQDDPNEAGHDVMFSYGGEQDYDAEGGDDVMLLGPGIQRSEGMLGFDWTSHKNDPQAGNSDMRITGLLPPSVETNRDRFDLVESLSGWNANDTLRGDDRDAAAMSGHELTSAGISRVAGLQGLLPAGATGFTGGNILLGGAGSDVIEGRGGDDLVDGDAWLNVQLQAPDVSTADPSDVKRVDTMASLQPDVFAGRLDPGHISIVRSVVTTEPGAAIDTAEYSGARNEYAITAEAGLVRVRHVGGTLRDGSDLLRNVEQLRFSGGQTVLVADVLRNNPATGTVTVSDTTPARGQLLTATATITDVDGVGTITTTWERETAAQSNLWTAVGTGTTYAPTASDVGARLRAVATFVDGRGFAERVASAPTAAVMDVAGPPTIGTATAGDSSLTVTWTAPLNTGGSPITSYRLRVRQGNGNLQDSAFTTTPSPIPGTATSAVVNGLVNGQAYSVAVTAVNAAGPGDYSAFSNTVTPQRAAGPDITAPTVTARSPLPDAVGVGRNANITATFGEALAAGVVNGTTFVLTPAAGGASVPAVVTYNATTRVATLDPSGSLVRTTQYRARLVAGTSTTGIRDLANNPFAGDEWTFTTGR